MAEPAHYQLPESWGDKAEDYESIFVPLSRPAAAAAVEAVRAGAGDRFLDIAAGTGAVTIEAARAGASVMAIDFAEGMLRFLQEKLQREGIDGVEIQRMDGQALEFPDETFDAAGSGFGVVWFPDREKGLREMRRVLKPGGRAFITSTGHPGSSALQELIAEASRAAGVHIAGPVPVVIPGADALEEQMKSAGFREVRVETRSVHWPIPDPGRFWEKWALGSPPGAARWRGYPDSVKQAAGREFVRLVEATGKSAFATEVLIALGRK